MNQIALIFGGPSAEHDVSLVSAKNIFQVLNQLNFKTSLLGVSRQKQWKLIKGDDLLQTDFINPIDLDKIGLPVQLTKTEDGVFISTNQDDGERIGPIDIAFPIIHGPYGEDGTLQAELNQLGLEFVGSDFLSCENSFDKAKTKQILSAANIPQVPYLTYSEDNPVFNEVKERLGLPFFIKPANMGSSIGISKVKTEAEMMAAVADARIHDKKIVIERAVTAREIECALLDDNELKVSGLGEVKPHHEFYSYEAKYLDPNGAELVIPADVEPEVAEKIKETALECFRLLDCRDYSRADFFLTTEGHIYFNEINTHPGFTNISQFPMLWKQEGISYKDLILKLINQAMKRRKGK